MVLPHFSLEDCDRLIPHNFEQNSETKHVGRSFSSDVRAEARTHMRIDIRLILDKKYAAFIFARAA
jgi:hypothetical protein